MVHKCFDNVTHHLRNKQKVCSEDRAGIGAASLYCLGAIKPQLTIEKRDSDAKSFVTYCVVMHGCCAMYRTADYYHPQQASMHKLHLNMKQKAGE